MLQALFESDVLLFTIPALLGTLVFLLRLGLMAIGGFDHDMDVPHDVDVPTDIHVDVSSEVDLGHDVETGHSTEAFKLLSIQSIAAFLMGFGWGGIGAIYGFDWPVPVALVVGAAFGLALVWLLGLLMKAMYDLQSSGTVRMADAVGGEGQVYANIPADGGGRGQVRVVIDDRARIYNAVSSGDAIKTGALVRIVRVNQDRTLTVTSEEA
jgi:membrane protein implicated in regulation of membrane protease activity